MLKVKNVTEDPCSGFCRSGSQMGIPTRRITLGMCVLNTILRLFFFWLDPQENCSGTVAKHPKFDYYHNHVIRVTLFDVGPEAVAVLVTSLSETHPISSETVSKHAAPGDCSTSPFSLSKNEPRKSLPKQPPWRAAIDSRLPQGRSLVRSPTPQRALCAHIFLHPPFFIL